MTRCACRYRSSIRYRHGCAGTRVNRTCTGICGDIAPPAVGSHSFFGTWHGIGVWGRPGAVRHPEARQAGHHLPPNRAPGSFSGAGTPPMHAVHPVFVRFEADQTLIPDKAIFVLRTGFEMTLPQTPIPCQVPKNERNRREHGERRCLKVPGAGNGPLARSLGNARAFPQPRDPIGFESPRWTRKRKRHRRRCLEVPGAGNGTRTRECQLGKLMPYHLAMPAYVC